MTWPNSGLTWLEAWLDLTNFLSLWLDLRLDFTKFASSRLDLRLNLTKVLSLWLDLRLDLTKFVSSWLDFRLDLIRFLSLWLHLRLDLTRFLVPLTWLEPELFQKPKRVLVLKGLNSLTKLRHILTLGPKTAFLRTYHYIHNMLTLWNLDSFYFSLQILGLFLSYFSTSYH